MTSKLAERAIIEALHQYCAAVDAYDTRGFLTLWAADAELDFGERYRGDPAGFMASVVEARSHTIAMTHQLGEVSIELSNDLTSATSSSAVSAQVTRLTTEGEQRRWVRGRYQDHWVLSEGRWLIQHRRYRPISETHVE